jgi:endonuclease I
MIKKITYLIILFAFGFLGTNAQTVSITSTGTAFTENFDGMGSSATAALPAGFKIGTDWTAGTSATTQAYGSTGAGAVTGTSGGGVINWANGITASSTDRSLGFLTSGSFASPRSIIVKLTNNTGGTITDLLVSFDYEKYRSGSRAWDWNFFHGATTTAATAATAGDQNYPADPNNLVISNPPLSVSKSVTLSGLAITPGSDYYLRWTYTGLAGSSNSQGMGIDNFSVTATGGGGPDVTPPTAASLVPADDATNVTPTAPLQLNFSENVLKGTGNILIRKSSDNSIVQTIDVASAAVVVTGTNATINIASLLFSTGYYIEIPVTAFADASSNAYAGISGSTAWNFTTSAAPAAGIIGANYSFADCSTFTADGWSQYSVQGPAQIWGCVAAAGRTGDNGMQMNGFAGTSQLNEDWLISPAYDLTAATLPTLKFYSKSQFAGNSLTLKISTNYVAGTDPNTATWTDLNGSFPAANSNVWTLTDNIDLTTYNTANVRLAWVYTSTTVANTSSRWTVDDVSLYTGVVLTPCDEPAEQPTNLALTSTPTSVSGTFTGSASGADGYLIVRSTASTLSAFPADGSNYTVGQSLGGGTVIANTTLTSFTDNGLTPSTAYYYFVFAVNSENCSGGANYLITVNPAPTGNTNTIATPAFAPCVEPTAPATALVLSATNMTISGTFTAAASANRYLVVISTNPTLSATPVDGTTYTVGTALGGGTVAAYTNTNSFSVTGLTPATQYYFFIFSVSGECTGEPDYYTGADLEGNILTTSGTGVPAGYYNAATGLSCQPLKTALKNTITAGSQVLGYTPGVWNIYKFSDIHRNDANTADIIWDMYSDNPTGPEPYTFPYGTAQCGGGGYSTEGDCYNREHSTPQSWFAELNPMVSDAHHIFATDGEVNNMRNNYPYGEVSTLVGVSSGQHNPSLNGSKLGTGSNFGYAGTVFEPINAYKGDVARAGLYMSVRYEDEIISQNWSSNGTGNVVFLSPSDEPDPAKRRLQIYDAWYLKTLIKWSTQDVVSQKEIDRNNAIYYQAVNTTSGGSPKAQGNRNPFVDHPEYVALIFQCTGLVPVTLVDFTAQKQNQSVLLKWYATYETGFRRYDVERSIDGITFNKIGEVAGTNLANYNFTDDKLPNNTAVVYYRLNMIDIDGAAKYSKVVPVRLNNNLSNAIVYPNPAKDNLNIKLYEALGGNSTLQVADVAGRIVKTQSVSATQLNISLDVKSLPAGRYFIKISNSKQVINQSFVVTQ